MAYFVLTCFWGMIICEAETISMCTDNRQCSHSRIQCAVETVEHLKQWPNKRDCEQPIVVVCNPGM